VNVNRHKPTARWAERRKLPLRCRSSFIAAVVFVVLSETVGSIVPMLFFVVVGCWLVGSDDLTGALHVWWLQLSPPALSSLLQYNPKWRHSGTGLPVLF